METHRKVEYGNESESGLPETANPCGIRYAYVKTDLTAVVRLLCAKR